MRNPRLKMVIALLALTLFGAATIVHAQATGTNTVAGAAGSLLSGTFDVVGYLLTPVSYALSKLMSYVTMLAGVALNATVYFTIIQMAQNFSHIGIETAWAAIRDVANMGFIFVLLYASIQLILGGNGGETRKLIVNMILAAILINFSLFFTKLIIDAANLLALTIYGAIVGPGGAALSGSDFLSSGISNGFMAALKLPELWQSTTILDGKTIFTVSILITVIELIAAFVFAAVALMLIIRYVVLIFVLIFSPIAFVASVFPGLSGPAKQWKDALVHQAFFAPLYFLLTWVALVVANGITTATFGNASLANLGNPAAFSPGLAPAFINYGVVITFLIMSLIVSKNFASKAGGIVSKITSTALGYAGGATFGIAGRVGRNTLGRAGQVAADSSYLKQRERAGGAKGYFARLSMAAGRKTAEQSFDVRGTGLGNPLEAGKAEKGGYADILKKKREAEKKYAESRGPAEEETQEAKKARASIERDGNTSHVDPNFLREHAGEKKRQEAEANKLEEAANKIEASIGSMRTEQQKFNATEEVARNRKEAKERRQNVATPLDYANYIAGIDKDKKKEQKESIDKDKKEAVDKFNKDSAEAKKVTILEKELSELEKGLEGLTGSLRDTAQANVDAKKQELETSKTTTDAARKNVEDSFETRKKAVDGFRSMSEQNKEAHAQGQESGLFIGKFAQVIDENMPEGKAGNLGRFFAKFISNKTRASAAEIRKGKKAVKDQLEDLLKAEGELKNEEEKVKDAVEDLAKKTGEGGGTTTNP